jgi:hypothetical protein
VKVLAEIDWSRPWLDHLVPRGIQVQNALAAGQPWPDALNLDTSGTVRFVPQMALPAGQAYEQFIFDTGSVPTRDNLHDFFNALCWLQFPRTKKKLNQLQAAEIAKDGVKALRGPVRDALTVFDENAAFWQAPQPLWDALEVRDWKRLFVTLRPLWRDTRLVLFGHALLEKLVYPRKAITAHVYHARAAIDSIANARALDDWVMADLTQAKLGRKPFLPMPVLGVPGWWSENENFSFYDDSLIFRPARQ